MKKAIYALNNGKFELKTEISYFLVNMTYCSHVKCILNMLTRNKEIFHDLLDALDAGNSAGHHGSPQFICNVLSVIGNLLNIGLNCQEENQNNNVQSQNTILEAFLTQGNLGNLEALQEHPNELVYTTVATMLDKYFGG